jgi:hypothetical protein
MKKGYQKDKTLARGKDVYIGIDVHKENWHVAASEQGRSFSWEYGKRTES